MGGLLTDIGSVCNTFSSVDKAKTFGTDILTNVGKSLGIVDKDVYKKDNTVSNIQMAGSKNNDIRGIKQVFRDNKYFFEYDKDYKCYNDDFYFNSEDGKQFKNAIQDIILYLYQPYKQTDLGTEVRKLKKEYGLKLRTLEGKKAFAADIRNHLLRTFK